MVTIDVQIIVLDGMTVNEAVTLNDDLTYTIFVNADLCPDKQRAAVEHALRHIYGNDFGKVDVQEIEHNAHA